jgi:ribose transport system permease protein
MSRQETAAATPEMPTNGFNPLRTYRTELAIALAIVVLMIGVGMVKPAALSMGNLINILQAAAPLIIMSLGVLLVVITGGIDLSVGSVFSLTGMVTALVLAQGADPAVGVLAGLGVGLSVGAVNGALVTLVGLAPFVVTLITYAVAGSLAFIVTNGRSMPVSTPDFWLLNSGYIVPFLKNHVLFCLVLLLALELFLRRIVFGRWFYAVGSSANAARLLGIPVRITTFMAYVSSGLSASAAGVMTVSYILNAEAMAGSSLMLQAIAAVVIGGASLYGGTGSAVGAVLGAVMITCIQNGVNLLGVNSFWQGSVTGTAILIAVLIDRFSNTSRK